MYDTYQFLTSTYSQTTYEFVEDIDKSNSEEECEQIKTWFADESFNRYTGCVARNCLHGKGTYDWKYDSKKLSYSGTFYVNNIDGYGQFSYPDGCVHEGLMKKNMRYGPGVFTQSDGLHNVGFWKGKQLIRLLQQLSSCVPHLASSIEAKLYLLRYRSLVRVQEDVPDPAKELMSEMKFDRRFLKHSMVLYLASVRQNQSLFINKPYFHNIFCNTTGDTDMFIEVEYSEDTLTTQENPNGMNMIKKLVPVTHIVAWNNTKMQIHMLKHIFKHRMSEVIDNIINF
ncbi:uncharacterized protein LOC126273074 isoform X1 [Schistocerca gregaria]|uniref:uncharacterized protein LOC126273074 isoform X1 n=1 Tax=Schistocerca gregaria TaxID=7010 RepID=UPI00211DBBE0|nr:uncharacterized protein LOC126273074 isoform X1 [Schistocerca gregaria]